MSFLGVPHLHPIILPLVPGLFWGWGYPSHQRMGYPPPLIQERMGYAQFTRGWGTPHLGEDGVPHLGHDRMRPPSQDRTGWGTPPPPTLGQVMLRTGYDAGGMLLAVSAGVLSCLMKCAHSGMSQQYFPVKFKLW